MELNSSKIFSGVDHSDARSLLYATGHLPENIGKKPLIGVVNTFNEIVPGHFHLRGIADAAKQGVLMAGGVPVEFPTIAICDGITMAHKGMMYPLPSRELIADSIEAMTMAQMKSGLTMQLLNHSRAASGAEHLMAHLVEMQPPRFENAEGIHGECVGVGTFACLKLYRHLATLPTPKAKAFEPLSEDWIRENFGDRLAAGIIKENENDILATFDAQNIVDHWDEIRDMINALPTVEELEALYKACGCKYLPEHIGIDPALTDEMLPISAAIRNRLTLVRMLRVLDFE